MPTTFNSKYFSKALRNARAGYGLREFSRKIGVSPTTLSRLERGGIPDMPTFTKVISYTGWNNLGTYFCEAHPNDR